jgi:hypothetical protein
MVTLLIKITAVLSQSIFGMDSGRQSFRAGPHDIALASGKASDTRH